MDEPQDASNQYLRYQGQLTSIWCGILAGPFGHSANSVYAHSAHQLMANKVAFSSQTQNGKVISVITLFARACKQL